MAINLFHNMRILLERRPVKLADDEQRLYELAFENFAPGEFMNARPAKAIGFGLRLKAASVGRSADCLLHQV